VGDERQLPAQGRGSDPAVTEVRLLVQGLAQRAAVAAETWCTPRWSDGRREGRGFGAEALDASSPAFAPVGGGRAVRDLGDGLLRDREPATEHVPAVERHERRLGRSQVVKMLASSRRCSTSFPQRAKASHWALVRSGMAQNSSSCSGSASVSAVSRSPGDQKRRWRARPPPRWPWARTFRSRPEPDPR
jgi:hypothetical protein